MMWSLPISVEIDGEEHFIRSKCEYRVVLDVIQALNDDELEPQEKVFCACYIFYEDFEKIKNVQSAYERMVEIINGGKREQTSESNRPQLMDWEQDFEIIAPAVSRVLGYSVRTAERYTHWFDFLGAYMEIGDCTFAHVVSIRDKKRRNKRLDKHEEQFYRENKQIIDLKVRYTKEEQEWLNSEW